MDTEPVRYDCAELRELYITQGQSLALIAARYGCSRTTISNWLRRCGVPARSGKFAARAVALEELRRLYSEEQLPVPQIAEALQVSVSTIYNRLRAGAIPRDRRRR